MSESRLHHCVEQIKVAEERMEPPARKCRCKKKVSLKKATEMVKNGEASFIVINRIREAIEEVCHLCQGDPEFKNCANCHGTGKELGSIVREDYGNDIVLVSRPPADRQEKKRSSALAAKTPRVATIEAKHIFLAYCGDNDAKAKAARDRIEEYGRLILDARMFIGKDRIPVIVEEPKDDKKTFTGPTFDYGRAV